MKLDLYSYFPITDYSNQIYYAEKDTRDEEFSKKVDLVIEDLAYCNLSERTIRLEMTYYDGNRYNYGRIHNGDKIYYIFIRSVEWNSNNTIVTLHYDYDYWQTYCYRIKLKKSLIEREHVKTDTKYKYLVDEGLPISTYKRKRWSRMILNSFTLALSLGDSSLVMLDGGVGLERINCVTKLNDKEYSNTLIVGDLNAITTVINWYVDDGKIDSIVGVYLIPNVGITTADCVLVTEDEKKHSGYGQMKGFKYVTSVSSEEKTFTISIPDTIDGYVPKNNKCFNSPYVICQLTNMNGNTVQIPLELSNGTVTVGAIFPASQGSTPVAYPLNFNSIEKNLEYAVSGLPTVQVPWNSDTFASYVAQNQNSITNNFKELERNREYSHLNNAVNTAVGLGGAIAADNVMGGVQTAVSGVMNAIGTEVNYNNQKARLDSALKDTASKGDLIHGSFNGTAPYLTGEYGFRLSILTVNSQNIEMIDNYFTMYGYKVNDIKVPDLMSRPKFNFIKTAGCNLTGSAPLEVINTIKGMFDGGCTLWHDIDTIFDYDQTNK